MERGEQICCRDCSRCQLPQAANIHTMMACAIDQIFQRQIKLEGMLYEIKEQQLQDSINLAKLPHKKGEEDESMDEMPDPEEV